MTAVCLTIYALIEIAFLAALLHAASKPAPPFKFAE
jgi:hypothetical protein